MRPKRDTNPESLERLCKSYDLLRTKVGDYLAKYGRDSVLLDDLLHDAILAAAEKDLSGMTDEECHRLVMFRANRRLYQITQDSRLTVYLSELRMSNAYHQQTEEE